MGAAPSTDTHRRISTADLPPSHSTTEAHVDDKHFHSSVTRGIYSVIKKIYFSTFLLLINVYSPQSTLTERETLILYLLLEVFRRDTAGELGEKNNEEIRILKRPVDH